METLMRDSNRARGRGRETGQVLAAELPQLTFPSAGADSSFFHKTAEV